LNLDNIINLLIFFYNSNEFTIYTYLHILLEKINHFHKKKIESQIQQYATYIMRIIDYASFITYYIIDYASFITYYIIDYAFKTNE